MSRAFPLASDTYRACAAAEGVHDIIPVAQRPQGRRYRVASNARKHAVNIQLKPTNRDSKALVLLPGGVQEALHQVCLVQGF